MKQLFAALWAVTTLAAHPAAAGDDDQPDFASRTVTKEAIASHIAALASDAYEGREPGTAGEKLTLEYLQKAFAAIGARPGNGKSYLQAVPLVAMTQSGAPSFAVRSQGVARPFEPRGEFMALAGRPVEKIDVDAAPIVFAGFGITAPEYDWNDYRDIDARGAVVVLLRSEPNQPADSTFFRGRDLTAHGAGAAKFELAARLGARAVILVHMDSIAGYPWSTLSGGGLGRNQLFLKREEARPELEAIVHLNELAARRMFTDLGRDFGDLFSRANQPGFGGVATGATASIAVTAESRKIQSHNVVAYLPGREAPDECVLYVAHWDHVGRNPALEGDQIFNGAVDNATGTAMLLEVARAFAAAPRAARRSAYFLATTAEEKGLLGAEYYARHPVLPLAQTAAVFNFDAHFPYGSYRSMTTPGFGLSELEDVMGQAAARLDRTLAPDPMPEAGAFYRADTYPFVKRGVPTIFSVGGPTPDEPEDSPVNQRMADYGRTKYHKPTDEYDPATWDLTGVEEDARVYFEAGWRVADDVRFPNWYYGNEFRLLRDAMRAPKRGVASR